MPEPLSDSRFSQPNRPFVPGEWAVFHYTDRHLRFVKDGDETNGGYEAELHYALSRTGDRQHPNDVVEFVERYRFPLTAGSLESMRTDGARFEKRLEVAERLLDHLWLVAGLSYYKMSAAPLIRIEGRPITTADLELHQLLLTRGLGEFCFTNGLDPELRPQYEVESGGPRDPLTDLGLTAGPLVPVGGGKDSCVTIESLRLDGRKPTLVTVRRFPMIQDVIDDSDLVDIAVERQLDPLISVLNNAGALNGHVPSTAIVSFAVMLTAILNGHDAVVMSNERSASEGNVEYRGVSINHQWAKSGEAETVIASAVARVTPELRWFSLLRPLSELDISRRFAAICDRYFGSFSSCNRTQYIDPSRRSVRWCGECPKCQFVYLALATALPLEQMSSIWGADLFSTSPVEGFRALLGLAEWKPFECVGEHGECRVALSMLMESPHWSQHPVLQVLADEVRASGGWPTAEDRIACFSPESAPLIPSDYAGVIRASS